MLTHSRSNLASRPSRACTRGITLSGRLFTIGRLDLKIDTLAVLGETNDLVFPANFQVWKLPRAIEQVPLNVVLLEIYEGWSLVSRFRKEIKTVDGFATKEDFAEVPDDTLVDHWLATPKAIEDLKRALSEANRT